MAAVTSSLAPSVAFASVPSARMFVCSVSVAVSGPAAIPAHQQAQVQVVQVQVQAQVQVQVQVQVLGRGRCRCRERYTETNGLFPT